MATRTALLRQCLLKPSYPSSNLSKRCVSTISPIARTRPTAPRTLNPNPLLQSFQKRSIGRPARDSTGTFLGNAKLVFRDSPFMTTLAVFIIGCGVVAVFYVNYYYQVYIIGAYHNYPEEVAKKLRRAIFYHHTDLQPKQALKYYRQAIEVAEEIPMDPMSDEIMGVKIEVAALFEKCLVWTKAIEVLERISADNLRWIDTFGDREDLKSKRTRVLKRTVAINLKLAEYYSNPAIWDRETAEKKLTWALEATLKESQRRQALGLSAEELEEKEGPWFSLDEQGATCEQLASHYSEKDQHYLAVPLLLQALNLKSTTDCHSVVLMSNLASSLAQQSPRAARAAQAYAESRSITTPGAPTGPVATRETMIQNARMWSEKAIKLSGDLSAPVRDDECDVGCVVATHNLGELAEMLGEKDVARKRYEEALSLARAIGFDEGVENTSERLRALKSGG
jgi:tetratricopeptide (TPR) repeat protein